MKFKAFIFARGGSKGLKNKNILKIGGIPLLVHTINLAKEIELIDDIFVSSDCPEICAIASKNGAKVIKRPKELAQDDSPEWMAWQHAIKYVVKNFGNFEGFLSLPTTSPLRTKEDVQKCLIKLKTRNEVIITITESKRNPAFNMVKEDKNNNIHLCQKLDFQKISRRQECERTFDITTVAYVSTTKRILNSKNIWDGDVKAVKIPYERSIDIDTRFDFEIANFLYNK